MISSVGQTYQKFNLLFLEEGEQYIQDFFGRARFFDINAGMYRVAELTIHFCSRGVILEFPKDPSLPLYKYHIRFFSSEP